MARQTFSITMDPKLVEKLDAVAKSNHRKRGPEVNVAVEFYLKYRNVDFAKSNVIQTEPVDIKEPIKEIPSETNFDDGEFGMD